MEFGKTMDTRNCSHNESSDLTIRRENVENILRLLFRASLLLNLPKLNQ